LPHRRRRDPFDAPGLDPDQLDRAMEESRPPEPEPEPSTADGDPDPDGDHDPAGGPDDGAPTPPDGAPTPPAGGGGGPDSGGTAGDSPTAPAGPTGRACDGRRDHADPPFRTRLLMVPGTGTGARAGRRSVAFTRSGRVVAARRPGDQARVTSVHLPATLAAAATAGRRRILPPDLRESVHKGRESNLVLFVVDASGSMAARHRMRAVKGAVLGLLRDAYQRRDKVGLVTFRGTGAELVLPPTTSHEIAAVRLRELRTGGRTPLTAALTTAARTVRIHRLRDPHRRALVVLVTDGRHTSGPEPTAAAGLLRGIATVVVDCESGPVRLGLARRLAVTLDAEYLRVDQLSATTLTTATGRRAA
jgi:magnesium chelatase subunit D